VRIIEFGDAALLVVLGEKVEAVLNRRVHRLARVLETLHAGDDRWGRTVPGYASLLVPFDPLRLGPAEAQAAIDAELEGVALDPADPESQEPRPPVLEVPVSYGGADGPDLEAVAERLGLAPADVVERHAAPTYTVFLVGFAPGFPYLGPLPDALALPRRETPRVRVPAGSVAIAGRQTGIYPFETPGGWHLIGRTSLRLWDPGRQPPALLEPGAAVRFVPT
jgi:KipI family sensor histidine kinase inhibitor